MLKIREVAQGLVKEKRKKGLAKRKSVGVTLKVRCRQEVRRTEITPMAG